MRKEKKTVALPLFFLRVCVKEYFFFFLVFLDKKKKKKRGSCRRKKKKEMRWGALPLWRLQPVTCTRFKCDIPHTPYHTIAYPCPSHNGSFINDPLVVPSSSSSSLRRRRSCCLDHHLKSWFNAHHHDDDEFLFVSVEAPHDRCCCTLNEAKSLSFFLPLKRWGVLLPFRSSSSKTSSILKEEGWKK